MEIAELNNTLSNVCIRLFFSNVSAIFYFLTTVNYNSIDLPQRNPFFLEIKQNSSHMFMYLDR